MNDGLSARPMPRFQPFFASPATGIDGTTSAGPARGCGPVVLRPLRVAGGLAATVMTLVALIFMALLHAPACAAEPPPAAASAWASVSALRVDATIGLHDAWDHLRILPESGEPMGADAAAARLAEFAPVGRLRSNLGKQPRGVWLALPVWRDPAQPARWVLQLDYASLDLIDGTTCSPPRAARWLHPACWAAWAIIGRRPCGRCPRVHTPSRWNCHPVPMARCC